MIMMIRRSIFGSISQYQYQYLHNSTICSSSATNPPPSPPPLSRVATLVEGCDYEHWLVVVEPPKGYPPRTQILNDSIKTLAIALGREEEAKKSIYSVSTKYYYAFGCKIPENLTHKIKSLPNVRWVLPDSYLCDSENDYGGQRSYLHILYYCYFKSIVFCMALAQKLVLSQYIPQIKIKNIIKGSRERPTTAEFEKD